MKKRLSVILCLLMLTTLVGCSNNNNQTTKETYEGAHTIILNNDSATIDGVKIEEYDYTWHCDPTVVHNEVKNAPAEYYTGNKPETDAIAYIDHELYYYPELNLSDYKLVNYDGEREYAFYYQDGTNNDYIFATLPVFNSDVLKAMMHTEEEAAQNKVLHITSAGTYIIEGTWNGQIYIDLGDEDENFIDETKKVIVVLNGVTINCTVAPGIIFDDLYECDNTWENKESYSADVDTTNAGVTVIIADNTTNSVTGQNIYRMLKTKYKDDNSTDLVKVQKKQRKIDAAFYSYVSMNIKGETNNSGTLTVTSNFEGLDSELHLTFLGGNITINSGDDGINVNEDNVSVVKFLGGTITINASNGQEGDGVDSNGYIVVDGSTLNINNVTVPDNALDSEDGVIYNSGTINIDGTLKTLEAGTYREVSGTNQGFNPGGNQQFDPGQNQGDMQGNFDFNNIDFDITEFKKKVAELGDDATLLDILEILGLNNFDMKGGMQGNIPGGMGEMPEGNQNPPEGFDPNNQQKPQ